MFTFIIIVDTLFIFYFLKLVIIDKSGYILLFIVLNLCNNTMNDTNFIKKKLPK